MHRTHIMEHDTDCTDVYGAVPLHERGAYRFIRDRRLTMHKADDGGPATHSVPPWSSLPSFVST